MGRKKIKIQPIKDDRNRQVQSYSPNHHLQACSYIWHLGHLFEKKARSHEEGVRVERPVRLRDCPDHIQFEWQAGAVC